MLTLCPSVSIFTANTAVNPISARCSRFLNVNSYCKSFTLRVRERRLNCGRTVLRFNTELRNRNYVTMKGNRVAGTVTALRFVLFHRTRRIYLMIENYEAKARSASYSYSNDRS